MVYSPCLLFTKLFIYTTSFITHTPPQNSTMPLLQTGRLRLGEVWNLLRATQVESRVWNSHQFQDSVLCCLRIFRGFPPLPQSIPMSCGGSSKH